MNLQIFTREKTYINILLTVLVCIFAAESAFAEWEIDLSRRRKETQKTMDFKGKPETENKVVDFVEKIIPAQTYNQEIVILNTEKGFLPATIHLKKNQGYNIHVVNVNEKEKNTSFIMDVFKENHATYFGQIKTFSVKPDKDGVYTFQCPETSIEGKVVIFSDENSGARSLANDKE